MTSAQDDWRTDKAAFEELVRKHQNRLFAIAFRLLRDRERAADMVQEAFVRIFRHQERFDAQRSFAAWSGRIVVNLCLNELRARKRWTYLEEEHLDPAEPTPELAMEELRELIRSSCHELSPQRQAIVALTAMGYSYDEIAAMMDWKVSQVKSELFRARQKLRQALQGKVVPS